MEDSSLIRWVWGWNGVGWWSVAARSTMLSKREKSEKRGGLADASWHDLGNGGRQWGWHDLG